MIPRWVVAVLIGCMALAWSSAAAQKPQEDQSGDVAENPGPLATDVSADLNPKAVKYVIRKVADWQLKQAESRFSTDWTYAALFDGLLAATHTTGDRR